MVVFFAGVFFVAFFAGALVAFFAGAFFADFDAAAFFVLVDFLQGAAGRILREVNGLVMDPNKSVWYYLANGQVADYTGLVQFDGAWFYVISGRLATEYSGQMEYDGEWFTVLNGQVV